ncbi:hypothetical protein PV10_02517 [Exophiala mesophila]|uniref:Uncharacterized protein n=1 Tax=Exophiala mesophila TaxID=212818 RepID=A0A0D1WZ54_EXOME|nr:uncharacterized protein PV10_02517 [Exophiala mesophila]KIV94785.1 hypothetical protein PV10_02517 [Exophiala mesophila]
MPAMTATARPTDDFDMGKLQKSLKQRQRHSIRIKPHVAKLTPAEIRSLNNSAIASSAGSHSSSHASSPARSRRSTTGTPPTSPDDGLSSHRHSVSRNSPHDVLTPPHTPSGGRRSSQSSSHSHHHHNHQHTYQVPHSNGIIYAPRPRGHYHASFMSSAPSSRPSSSSSSTTYRGLPTYRGPEVTRTGSMNMLQRPSATIVANPLSQFSRPRQSAFGVSPERHRHSQDLGTDRSQSLPAPRANSISNISVASSRPASPPRVTDSPVSMMVEETEAFPVLDPNDPHNQPKEFSDSDDIEHDPVRTPSVNEQPRPQPPRTLPVAPMLPPPQGEEQQDQQEQQEQPPPLPPPPASPKKDKQRRFTISSALFGGDKSNASDEKPGKLRKARRQTLTSADGQQTDHPDSEKNETAQGAQVEEKDETQALSVIIPDTNKGKEKEIQSAPVYSRCSCCGKVKKPSGFSSGLSPVMENENLRTNFSFELERTSESSSGRRLSDASRRKFTPIIPMPISETETRQATIEPLIASPTHVNKEAVLSSPQSSIEGGSGQGSSPVTPTSRRPRKHLDPPKFVRFASLHGRRNVDSVIIAEEEEEIPENTPLMEGQGQGQQQQQHLHEDVVETEELFYGNEDTTELPDVVISQPVFDMEPIHQHQPLIQPRVLVQSPSSSQRTSQDLQHHRPSVAGSDSDMFFTPRDGISPAGENPPSPAAAAPTLLTRTSFLDLPESNLDLQLKDFGVTDKSSTTTTIILTEDAAIVDGVQLDRKPGSEVRVA